MAGGKLRSAPPTEPMSDKGCHRARQGGEPVLCCPRDETVSIVFSKDCGAREALWRKPGRAAFCAAGSRVTSGRPLAKAAPARQA